MGFREFARERLTESGAFEAMQARHATYFLARAEEAAPHVFGPAQRTWVLRVTANGPLRVFTLLHAARPVLLNLGGPGIAITPWADRVQVIDATYGGRWELPVLGAVTAPTAVLIRPDGYGAWVGDLTHPGLPDALTT